MSEGGVYPWKVQKIELPKRGRYASVTYADLSRPLPDPPDDRTWVRDARTREWKLVPLVLASASSAQPVAVARALRHAGCADDASCPDDDALLTTAVPVTGEASASAAPIVDKHPPAGGGVVRYHEVLPTDTFQGVCLRYGVTPTELRRANRMLMTGSDLKLAPEVLVIPSNDENAQHRDDARVGWRRRPTREEKIATLVHRASRVAKDGLSYSEALAYLDMADGDVDRAISNVREDIEWSAEEEGKIETVVAGASSSSSRIIVAGGGGGGSSSSGAVVLRSSRPACLEMADWDVSSVALGSIREDFGTS